MERKILLHYDGGKQTLLLILHLMPSNRRTIIIRWSLNLREMAR